MPNIFEQITKKYKLFSTTGASKEAVKEAELQLGRDFSRDYKEYLLRYGAISFSNTEITGLNIDRYANVVDVTLREIALDPNFPKDCVVLENLAMECLLILINTAGEILEYRNSKLIKLYDSMKEYLESKL